MWEEYEITPNNALQYRKEEMNDRHVMKQQIHKLKDEIRALSTSMPLRITKNFWNGIRS